MRMIKLHYDGWLALPTGMREALGLSSGNRVEVELVDGTLVLRPATKAEKAAADASAVDVREPPAPDPVAKPTKRKPGRHQPNN